MPTMACGLPSISSVRQAASGPPAAGRARTVADHDEEVGARRSPGRKSARLVARALQRVNRGGPTAAMLCAAGRQKDSVVSA